MQELGHQAKGEKNRREAADARKATRRQRADGTWENTEPAEPLKCVGCATVYDKDFDMLTCPKCDGELVGASLAAAAAATPRWRPDGYHVGIALMGVAAVAYLFWAASL